MARLTAAQRAAQAQAERLANDAAARTRISQLRSSGALPSPNTSPLGSPGGVPPPTPPTGGTSPGLQQGPSARGPLLQRARAVTGAGLRKLPVIGAVAGGGYQAATDSRFYNPQSLTRDKIAAAGDAALPAAGAVIGGRFGGTAGALAGGALGAAVPRLLDRAFGLDSNDPTGLRAGVELTPEAQQRLADPEVQAQIVQMKSRSQPTAGSPLRQPVMQDRPVAAARTTPNPAQGYNILDEQAAGNGGRSSALTDSQGRPGEITLGGADTGGYARGADGRDLLRAPDNRGLRQRIGQFQGPRIETSAVPLGAANEEAAKALEISASAPKFETVTGLDGRTTQRLQEPRDRAREDALQNDQRSVYLRNRIIEEAVSEGVRNGADGNVATLRQGRGRRGGTEITTAAPSALRTALEGQLAGVEAAQKDQTALQAQREQNAATLQAAGIRAQGDTFKNQLDLAKLERDIQRDAKTDARADRADQREANKTLEESIARLYPTNDPDPTRAQANAQTAARVRDVLSGDERFKGKNLTSTDVADVGKVVSLSDRLDKLAENQSGLFFEDSKSNRRSFAQREADLEGLKKSIKAGKPMYRDVPIAPDTINPFRDSLSSDDQELYDLLLQG